jgi:ribonuclease HI
MNISIFTDGLCEPNPNGRATWGWSAQLQQQHSQPDQPQPEIQELASAHGIIRLAQPSIIVLTT